MMRLCLFLLIFISSGLQAHQLSTAYLTLAFDNKGVAKGELQVRLYDLEQALAIDENGDGKLLWGEVQKRTEDINDYLSSHLKIKRNSTPCTLALLHPWKIDSHFNEGYLLLPIHIQCPLAGELQLSYSAFFDVDAQHKLLLNIRSTKNNASENRVISSNQHALNIHVGEGNRIASFKEFIYQGMIHIWQGTDHILFLCSLLLTCVLVRKDNFWSAKSNLRDIFIDTTWIVTAFTLAHSVTLSATALNLLHFPSRWIEVGIAISVAFTAINNIFPMVLRLGVLTFGFGLLHGMGFAGALGELGIPGDQQLLTVLAFNLGVEIGQMAIVLAVLPLLIIVRKQVWYSRFSVSALSTIIAVIATQWVIQRISG